MGLALRLRELVVTFLVGMAWWLEGRWKMVGRCAVDMSTGFDLSEQLSRRAAGRRRDTQVSAPSHDEVRL